MLVPAQAAQLSFAAALAVADVIDATAPSLAAFKWPNDVLIHGRKIAGILLESAGGGSDGAVQWLAIGIGINLAHHPDGVEFAATSLAAEGLTPPPLAEAMTHLADALDRWMEIHAREGFEPLRRAWLARGPRPGAKLTVRLGNQSRVGVFADLSGEGALILRSDDSTFETVTAGEVFFDG
jgi:BirA family biotin operon repressor/biotin-[acetyl-CoA-carboxylase] ligase